MSNYERYLYGAGIVFGAFYRIMAWQLGYFGFVHMAMRIRVTLSTVIYRKVLRLTRSGEDKANIGHVLNLVSSDVCRFENALIMALFFVISPLVLIICGYTLWAELGLAAFAGIGAIFLLAPVQCNSV